MTIINFSEVVNVKGWTNEMNKYRKQQIKCYRAEAFTCRSHSEDENKSKWMELYIKS